MPNWNIRRRNRVGSKTISVTDARGAITGTGTIWILIISTALAAIVLIGLWAMNSRDLLAVDQRPGHAKAPVASVKVP